MPSRGNAKKEVEGAVAYIAVLEEKTHVDPCQKTNRKIDKRDLPRVRNSHQRNHCCSKITE